jgi:hypothetical protein
VSLAEASAASHDFSALECYRVVEALRRDQTNDWAPKSMVEQVISRCGRVLDSDTLPGYCRKYESNRNLPL